LGCYAGKKQQLVILDPSENDICVPCVNSKYHAKSLLWFCIADINYTLLPRFVNSQNINTAETAFVFFQDKQKSNIPAGSCVSAEKARRNLQQLQQLGFADSD